MNPSLPRLSAGLAVLLCGVMAGCFGSRSAEIPPEHRFGNRPGAADSRQTVIITPADSAITYFYYPAIFDTLIVRPAPFEAGQAAVPVEVLVKGAFPDGCMELHDVEQKRIGHLVNVSLAMRRPQRALCASVVRPYRFYLLLDGTYAPGPYTLTLNEGVHPFEVRAPIVDE